MRRYSIIHIVIALILSTAFAVAQVPLAVKTFVEDPALENASVGIYIKDVQSGEVLVNYRGKTNLIPASVTKILTTATAIEMLTDTFCFKTRVVMEGKLAADSVLDGNIYVIGSGDPTLESGYMKGQSSLFADAQAAIAKRGVKRVEGAVIGDASLYTERGSTPLWLIEDVGTYYAPTPSALSVFDNVARIYVGSDSIGGEPKVYRVSPHTDLFHFSLDQKICEYRIYAADYSWDRTIQGPFEANKKFEISTEIPEPALFVADSLQRQLINAGISFAFKPSTAREQKVNPSDSCMLLCTYRSQPLSQILKQTNYRSINLYAENLYLYLSTLNGGTASHYASANVISSYWNTRGLNARSIFQVDGSGLSMKNSINPEFLTNLLVYMKKTSRYKDAFYNSLPICGVSGTVKSFLAKTPLAGKAHFKSGSMERVQNYAGYVEYAGRTYAVSLMVNNFACSRSELKGKMSKMLNSLFKQ